MESVLAIDERDVSGSRLTTLAQSLHLIELLIASLRPTADAGFR